MAKRTLERRGDQPGAALRHHRPARAAAQGRRRTRRSRSWCTTSSTTTTSGASASAASGAASSRSVSRPSRCVGEKGATKQARVSALYTYEGRSACETNVAQAGDIVADRRHARRCRSATRSPTSTKPEALPRITVEEPTIKVRFVVNTSPFAGKVGQVGHVAPPARAPVRRRSHRNLALRVEDTDEAGHLHSSTAAVS